LVVSDNGKGCDAALLTVSRAGMGVRSMHARAQSIGGHIEFASRPGRGLRVTVTCTPADEPLQV
jgi:signal transduction histidine kinase